MRTRVRRLSTLSDIDTGRGVEWYWKLIALAASWMILGGFLMLPASFDKDPQLRFSNDLLIVFIVVLVAAGFMSTALVCFACRNWLFLADTVFLPAFTACGVGLLTTLFSLLSSTRYTWNKSAIAGTVIGGVSLCVYSVLYYIAHRKVSRERADQARRGKAWQAPIYYQNYLANEYPGSRKSGASNLSEEEMTRQQMLNLLMTADRTKSVDASSTFRIDLPGEEEDGLHEAPASRPSHDASSTTPLIQQGLLPRVWEPQRGRSGSQQSSQSRVRAVSREERRRQIEHGP